MPFISGALAVANLTPISQQMQEEVVNMVIADRLRNIRKMKKLSQGEMEKRTGLLRSHLSRVENGHTVPTIETLEKLARALEVPLYQLFYEDEKPPELPVIRTCETSWGGTGKEACLLRKLQKCLEKMDQRDRQILLKFAARVSRRNKKSH